jgi:pimeloyl-ACP methyl ester carboxylesterase
MCLLPSALLAEFVSIPTVLDVHGLDFSKISCDPGSIQGAAHNEACYQAAKIFAGAGAGRGEFDDRYFDLGVRGLCGDDCAEVTGFTWGGDIKTSRAAVDRLKEEIVSLGTLAKKKGAPFIIIAHSWGTVLSAEALAELDNDPRTEGFTVDKFVTMGSPLGSTLYSLAIDGLISRQNFYAEPQRGASIKKWVNYYASRDLISSKVPKADENVRMDADAKYDEAENNVRMMAAAYIPQAMDDMKYFTLQGGTEIWHAAYYSEQSIYLDSLGKYLVVDPLKGRSGDYFQP